MGQLYFSRFDEIASKNRLNEWFTYQINQTKPISYLLPSIKWFNHARQEQPGLAFQTFDDLANLFLTAANIEHISISEEDRVLFFYEILNRKPHFLSEKELMQNAQAYADSYGQLKRLGLQVEETPEPLKDLMEEFYIYEHEYRDKKSYLDPENRIIKTVELSMNDIPFSHVVIEGYFDFSPLQYLFIELLIKHHIPLTIYLPALDTPIIHETVSTLKKFGVQVEGEFPTLELVCKKRNLSCATTIEEEIHGVLEAIAQSKGTGKYNHHGIVLANESHYLEKLMEISDQKQIPLNRVKVQTIDQTNVLSFITQLLNKEEYHSKWDELPIIDTIAKLCFLSPLEFNHVKETFIKAAELKHTDIQRIFESTKTFQAVLPDEEKISTYLSFIMNFLENSPLPTIWRNVIKEKHTFHLKFAALEMRAFQRVMNILQEMLELSTAQITVKLETFKTKLLHTLQQESLYIDRRPTDGIELFTFRDVQLFRGNHIFVLGLNEGEFPSQKKLSGYFQERYLEKVSKPYPLPLSDYFRQKDDASFAQLKYLAEELSFSYVEGMNPHQPLLPSKYVMEMERDENYSMMSRYSRDIYLSNNEYDEICAYHLGIGKQLILENPRLQTYKNNLKYLETGVEEVSPKWEEKLSKKRTSITSLESYAACSFRFGLDRHLKIPKPLEKQIKIDPIETGNMLHRIIERFYQEALGLPFSRLSNFFIGRDEEKLASIFEEEWDSILQKHPDLSVTIMKKEKEEWWRKLKRWLAAERKVFWENHELADMTIFKMEEPVELTIELKDGNVLTLTGKIDRIDIDEHGYVIYDYKSSKKELDFDKQVPAGLMLQIPLYMHALDYEFKHGKYKTDHNNEAIGGGYISIKEPHHRKKNTVWKDEEHKKRFEPNNRVKTHIMAIDRDSLDEKFNLKELIEGLWRGTFTDFSIRPFSADSCKFCDYKAICRVTKEQQD